MAAATVTRGATTPLLTPLLLRAEVPAVEVLLTPLRVVMVVAAVVLLLLQY